MNSSLPQRGLPKASKLEIAPTFHEISELIAKLFSSQLCSFSAIFKRSYDVKSESIYIDTILQSELIMR